MVVGSKLIDISIVVNANLHAHLINDHRKHG